MRILVVLIFVFICLILEFHLKTKWTSEIGKRFLLVFEPLISIVPYFIIKSIVTTQHEFNGYQEVGFIVIYILTYALIFFSAKYVYENIIIRS